MKLFQRNHRPKFHNFDKIEQANAREALFRAGNNIACSPNDSLHFVCNILHNLGAWEARDYFLSLFTDGSSFSRFVFDGVASSTFNHPLTADPLDDNYRSWNEHRMMALALAVTLLDE